MSEKIILSDVESIIVLSCKGWKIDDEHLYDSFVQEYKDLSYEDFIKENPLKGKLESVRKEGFEQVKKLIEYKSVLKFYLGIYGCSLSYETYANIINILTDVVYEINPSKLKRAIKNVHGKQSLTSYGMLAELIHCLSNLSSSEVEFKGKYLPKKFIEQYVEVNEHETISK